MILNSKGIMSNPIVHLPDGGESTDVVAGQVGKVVDDQLQSSGRGALQLVRVHTEQFS